VNYKEFLSLKEKPVGKASAQWTGFPLAFDSHKERIDDVECFSVIGDFMIRKGMDDFKDDFNDARISIFEYITVFFNRDRKHSFLDYTSPEKYELNRVKNIA
jgi:hypothetical protein